MGLLGLNSVLTLLSTKHSWVLDWWMTTLFASARSLRCWLTAPFTSLLPVFGLSTRCLNLTAGICVHSTTRALILAKSSTDVVGEAWLTVGAPVYSRGVGWGWGHWACKVFPHQRGKTISIYGAGFVHGSIVINRKGTNRNCSHKVERTLLSTISLCGAALRFPFITCSGQGQKHSNVKRDGCPRTFCHIAHLLGLYSSV